MTGGPAHAATVSLLAAEFGKPGVQCLEDANKALRFFKENADVPLRYPRSVQELADVRLRVHTDAAWAKRLDNSSQGGYMLFAMDEEGMQTGRGQTPCDP